MAKILVAEDNFANQRLLSYRLRKLGHTVEVCNDGIEALKLIENEVFDLAILDISMPNMDGLTLLKNVRQTDGMENLPVIMLTASAIEQHRNIAAINNVGAFLEKPISSQVLKKNVNQLIGASSQKTAVPKLK